MYNRISAQMKIQDNKMKKKGMFCILFLCWAMLGFSKSNSWGNLKKIYFYDSAGKYSKVVEELKSIDLEDVSRAEQKEIAQHLINFGDYYRAKNENTLAKAFYDKVIDLSPEYWYIYNKLEMMNRGKGDVFPDFKNVFKQLGMVFRDFKSAFLVLNTFFNTLFFSGIVVFFILAAALFINYFKLAGHDLLIDEKGGLSFSKSAFVIAVIFWPILMLSGWVIYPFLICGFLWVYLSNNEKKTVTAMIVLIFFLSLIYSINLSFERKISSKEFKITQSVNEGKLFDKDEYENFDDELKVFQAFSYYKNKQNDTALDILLSTKENYRSVLKYNLMGNIYYSAGDMAASIRNFKEALNLDDNNEITLNNFTLALMQNENPRAFDLWAKRYPALKKYKDTHLELKEIKHFRGVFWKRLLNLSGRTFDFLSFLKNIFSEFFKLPILYCILLFIAYTIGVKKMYPNIGESTYCSKCSKIIKRVVNFKTSKLCEECHQLFLVKDVIFLEAKVLKEKEITRKARKKYSLILLSALVIPGLNLHYRRKNWLFVTLAMFIYILAGFAGIGIIIFNKMFSAAPIMFNYIGVAAVVLFFLVNIFSIIGEGNGI